MSAADGHATSVVYRKPSLPLRSEPQDSRHSESGTAAAVADFGRRTNDRIEIAANGRVRLARRFGEGHRFPKTMRAWFHFVGMPVQVGEVTSPQSMLAPLKVIGSFGSGHQTG
jgi:hypothetical protein